MKYQVITKDGRAKRAQMETVHGTIQTPVFMNVGTVGAIKGAVSTMDLKDIGTQVELSNTYHLHLRPGHELVREAGGLHEFSQWHGPMLTDSGGFQVFSLASMNKIHEEGVEFSSHIDGHKMFFTPEYVMEIEQALGADIAMAFDECAPADCDRSYTIAAMNRTHRWAKRCKESHTREDHTPMTASLALNAATASSKR